MLIFAEYAARDRHWLHFGVLGILGLAAAVKRLFTLRLSYVPRRGDPVRARWVPDSTDSNNQTAIAEWSLADSLNHDRSGDSEPGELADALASEDRTAASCLVGIIIAASGQSGRQGFLR